MKNYLFIITFICSLVFSGQIHTQILWQDDFSNTSNWTISNSASFAGPVNGWGFDNLANNSIWLYYVPNINGGYIKADGTVNVGTTGNDLKITNVNSINLSGHPNVILEWDDINFMSSQDQTQLGFYDSPINFTIRISNNGGATWSTINLNNSLINSPVYSGHRKINISQYCGNQSNVKIQFRINGYSSTNNNGDNNGDSFYWGIDNVKIRKLLPNDLNIENAEIRLLTASDSVPHSYTKIPSSQVKPFQVAANITNYGLTLQNALLNVVFNANNYNSNANSISSLNNSVLNTIGNIPLSNVVGNYIATANANSTLIEGYPIDNSTTKTIEVTESIYSRSDQYLYPYIADGNPGDNGYGQIYEINSSTYIRNIKVFIPSDSNIINKIVFSTLYTFNPSNFSIVKIGQSSNFTINANHLGTWVTIPLTQMILLNSGQLYIAGLMRNVLNYNQNVPVFSFSNPTHSLNSVRITNQGNLDVIQYNQLFNENPMINIQVCQPSSTVQNITSCDNYQLPNGTLLNSSGIHIDTLINMNGCDSIVTYNVTIFNSAINNITQITCDFPFIWNGQSYNSPGNYTQILQNINGCDSTVNLLLSYFQISPIQDVCIISNDVLTGKNKVVWEKEQTTVISSYNMYRENTQSGSFDLIGTTNYADSSWFLDLTANPNQQAYRYHIKYVDTCGNESLPGLTHKTMHLTINQGIGTTWNLIWTPYEGINYPSYNIYRGTNISNMTLLTTVPSNLTSYTDANAPGGLIYYQIEIQSPNTCNPTKLLYNNSRSNISSNDPNVSLEENYSLGLKVYPNPTSIDFTIECDENFIGEEFILTDFSGRNLKSGTFNSNFEKVEIETFANGVYLIQVKNRNIQQRIIKH